MPLFREGPFNPERGGGGEKKAGLFSFEGFRRSAVLGIKGGKGGDSMKAFYTTEGERDDPLSLTAKKRHHLYLCQSSWEKRGSTSRKEKEEGSVSIRSHAMLSSYLLKKKGGGEALSSGKNVSGK